MSVKVTTIGLKGMEGYKVTVEVHAINGPEAISIVGLPDASVKEAKDRMYAALHSLRCVLSDHKIIIHLSPGEQKKNGTLYDLPMAIGVIHGKLEPSTGFIGELSLDGGVQPTEGMLPAILAAKKIGLKRLYLPYDETIPSYTFDGMELVYISSLQEVMQHIDGQNILSFPIKPVVVEPQQSEKWTVTFQQIIGHDHAKRALEIAAAGGHHLFMTGPPGCGKSMLAESVVSILPKLDIEEQLEVISLYNLSGAKLENGAYCPFRSPHHSSSSVSIIGGGQRPKPGEISLAHHGVLFLDEMAEFTKKTLDMLRQPLESGTVTISRASDTVTFPSQFMLIGAMNPCPCGYLGAASLYCTCSPKQIINYQNRLSGPIRDRFDIFLNLKPVDFHKKSHFEQESSATVQERVSNARNRQNERYKGKLLNGRVSFDTLIKTSPLEPKQLNLLRELSASQNLSNRAQLKILRLARTISDLDQSETITDQSIWEAMKLYRGDKQNKIQAHEWRGRSAF